MNCIDIFGYDGRYEIDTDGNVFSNVRGKRKKLKHDIDVYGYHTIKLAYNKKSTNFKIHRLIAYHFIENDDAENNIQIHHKNQKRDDNRIENLEWVSNLTNCQSCNRGDNKSNTSGYRNISYDKRDKLWIFRIRIDRKLNIKYFKTQEEAIEYKQEFLKSILTDPIH